MFERFTARAKRSLELAQSEAKSLDHGFLGTEHLLLGLLAEGGGVAARVLLAEGLSLPAAREAVVGRGGGIGDAEALATIGIDLDAVRSTVEESFGPGALDSGRRALKGRRASGARFFTPKAKKALEMSLREALALGHNYIGTEHILLGLIRLGDGVAYDVLDDLAPPASALRAKVLAELTRMA
jgi:ATP-dependent Clp protease ATP-binding subunit ClpA